MTTRPVQLGVRNPSSQASASSDRAADAETNSAVIASKQPPGFSLEECGDCGPQIEGFLRAISLHTGIPYDELTELYSVRRAGPHKPKVLTEAPVGATLRSEGRG